MPHVMQKFKDIERGQLVRLKASDSDAVVVGFVPHPPTHVFAEATPNASFGEAEPLVHVMWVKDGVMGQAQVPVEALEVKDEHHDDRQDTISA